MNSKMKAAKAILIAILFLAVSKALFDTRSTPAMAADVTEKKVTLDPGHGWLSAPGAVANGMQEKDVALEIANLVKPLLEAQGVQVFMTRTGDEPTLDLSNAALRANQYQSDLVVSIHLNAGGGTGTESCYQVVGSCTDPFSAECINRPANENSKKLAMLLTNKVNSTLGLRIRGDFPEHTAGRCDRYASTNWWKLYIHDMTMPAAVIETAFIDGPADVDVKMLKERRADFAKAIADAVIAYLKIPTQNATTANDIPDPDAYSCLQPGYVDFEDFPDQTNLSSGTIAGMQFTTTNGYSWLVGDFDSGSYNGKYPYGSYMSQGTHWAWLGVIQGAGRIDFPKGPASYFSLLVSNTSGVYVDAYDANGQRLVTAGPSPYNTETGHMTELKITRATADMAYVMVHDQGNYFEIDSVCTNAPGTPTTINRVVDQIYPMQTGQHVTGSFFLDAATGFWRYLRIFVGPFYSDVDIVVTRPDGTIVNPGDPGFTLNKTPNSIEVILEGANAGTWQYEIIANQLEPGGENIQVTVDEQLINSENAFHTVDSVGVFRPSNGVIFLKNRNITGYADLDLHYGIGGDHPVVGDWDGNGTDTVGVYRGNTFYLRNSNMIGYADFFFNFGVPGDQPIAGDWDGDGIDTIGVYRSSTFTFYLRNSNVAGDADMIFRLGIPGDVAITGDWTGKGYDTVGVFRPSNGVIYLKNTNDTGYADIAINYGIGGDKPIAGDWDNDGVDTIGVLRGNMFYLRNSNTIGYADVVFALGLPNDMPIAGNWDGLP